MRHPAILNFIFQGDPTAVLHEGGLWFFPLIKGSHCENMKPYTDQAEFF